MGSVTQIQLLGTTIGYLDVMDGTNFPITFSVADIRDITKKNGTFSKSITLPGSKNNNKLLNNYYDINIEAGTFDINKVQDCIVIQNGVQILDNAVMQLLSINKSQTNGNYEEGVTYTVLIKDKTADFFTNINNKLLTDLDFSEFNHTYNSNNVISSFSGNVNNGYKYVMAYNPNYYSTGGIIGGDAWWNLEEYQPGIYVKKYFDKIFSNAGFSYEFINYTADTIGFDKLIIPYNGDKIVISANEYDYKLAKVQGTSPQSIGLTNSIYNNGTVYENDSQISAPTVLQDKSGSYNTGTSTYVMPVEIKTNEYLEIKYEVDYDVRIINTASTQSFLSDNTGSASSPQGIDIVLFGGTLVNGLQVNGLGTPNINPYIPSNVAFDDISIPYGYVIAANSTNTIVSGKKATFWNQITPLTPTDLVKANFGLKILTRSTTAGITNWGWYQYIGGSVFTLTNAVKIEVVINSIKLTYRPKYTSPRYGSIIALNTYIPKQIKQSDFIKSVMTMYNLYVYIDKNNPNNLIFKTRDSFYDDGELKDWTNKLAKDRSQDIQFLPELNAKKLRLTYKNDEEVTNKVYFEATNEIYGQLEYTFTNDYIKGLDIKELIFSPTPMFNAPIGAVLPMWNTYAPKIGIRILYDGGLQPCSTYYISNYVGNNQSYTYYPHISHWNTPYNPTFDINFGVCDYYFRNDDYGSDTNNNLFNLFWRRTINQLNSSKLLTAYFNLQEGDIHNLSLSDRIRIDNSWWNINKVIDYNANENTLTKVELISVDDTLAVPYKTKARPIVNGSPTTITPTSSNWAVDIWSNIYTNAKNWGNNTISGNYPIDIIGTGNLVGLSATKGVIYGNNNSVDFTNGGLIIGDNNTALSKSSIVLGSGNTVDASAKNALVIGDNITATLPNSITAPNIVALSGLTVGNMTISPSSIGIIPITWLAFENDLNNGNLTAGSWYYITDTTTNGYQKLYINAITNSEVSPSAKIELDIILNDVYNGLITTQGVWRATNTYSINDIVRYYGRLWTNLTGNAGSVSGFGLDTTNWSMIPVTNINYYYKKIFDVIYDKKNDIVNKLIDNNGNTYIMNQTWYGTWQWFIYNDLGNDGILYNTDCSMITNNETNNITGNKNCEIYDNDNTSLVIAGNNGYIIYGNKNIGEIQGNISSSPLVPGSTIVYYIGANDLSSIFTTLINNNYGIDIQGNNFAGDIMNNVGTGQLIDNNSIGGTGIANNVLNGNISSNTNTGSILFNTSLGAIQNNSNLGDIIYNDNNGVIDSNANSGSISYNKNQGTISNNTNTGSINFNQNTGRIDSNINLGSITYNINDGEISGNNAGGDIAYNTNKGFINGNTANARIQYNSNNGDIDSNTLNSIELNSNNGMIYQNNIIGDISYNTNSGQISSNQNLQDIINNSNNGDITNNNLGGSGAQIIGNNNNGHILNANSTSAINIANNINNGNIGPGTYAANVTDPIVNK